MRLSKALKEKMTDLRLRDKFLAEGKLSHGQFDDYLKKLKDDTDNATFVEEESESQEQID